MEDRMYDMVVEAMRLIQRRSVDPRRTVEQRTSYGSAYDMLMYALQENAECLAQYDDVVLSCDECGKCDEDGMTAMSYERLCMCNACENHEFFEPKKGVGAQPIPLFILDVIRLKEMKLVIDFFGIFDIISMRGEKNVIFNDGQNRQRIFSKSRIF